MIGKLAACHGWVNDVKYHGFPGAPVPTENWCDDRTDVFRFDVWWDLGCPFVQEWRLENDKLVPASPLYKRGEPVTQVEVTPGRFLNPRRCSNPTPAPCCLSRRQNRCVTMY